MHLKKKRKINPTLLLLIIISLLIYFTTQQCLTYHQYFDSTYNTCLPCAYNCLTCLDSNICALCADQFYIDNNSNSCLKCPFGCKTCTDSTICITCNTGLYIDGNSNCLPCSTGVSSCSIAVIQSCHDQYFLLGGICAGCLDNCKYCQDFVTCTQCDIGYYLATDYQSCLKCSSNCQICTSPTICTSCTKGYQISSNACVLSDCSFYPFCIRCNALGCLACQQGKYLSTNGSCTQGASIICEQSSGPYYTNCQTDDYGCPSYAVVQQDLVSSQDISVCIPYSATQYGEYIYEINDQSNCVSSQCGTAFSQILSVTTIKSYYQIEYNLNIRLYKNPTHTINITALNKTTQSPLLSKTHVQSIAQELSIFNQQQAACNSCPYGQIYLSGTLLTNGYQLSQFNISNQNGQFTVIEYVFKFLTCTVDKCQTCTTVSDCTLCIQPYFLQLVQCVSQCDAGFYMYQRYCLLQCPSDTFSIQSSYECQACTNPCKTCSSQTSCLSCVSGYFLEGENCVVVCSSNQFFGNTTSNECQSCPNPCSTCQALNSTFVKCLSCMVGYLYLQQSCVFSCPLTLYNTFQNQVSQCSVCNSSCTTCYISNSTCLGCTSGYLLYQNFCNQTTFCQTGYFISINNVCLACQFPCATCNSISTNCTSCLKGVLYQSTCMTTCLNGYYIDATQISNITCVACTNNCLTCISGTLCLSCGAGRFLYQNSCLTNCPLDTYYQNSTINTCTECLAPCKQCTSALQCLSCATGYLDGTSCTLLCNSSSYINSNFKCIQCTNPCIECYSTSQCTKCLLPYILYNITCMTVSVCQALGKYVSYKQDQITNVSLYGQCKQCTYPCLTCKTSSIICQTCATSYLYLSDLKTCLQQCPVSYYESLSQCLKCNQNCYQCQVSSTNCTSCSSGLYLDQITNICVSICSNGYYADNQYGKCLECVSPCLTCYNIYFCKSCKVGIFYNKICVDTCPAGTIYNSTINECVICTNNCLTCSGITSNCSACISGYFFNPNNNTCTATCSSTYYADSYTQSCESCISPCATCTSSIQCITCIASYFLNGKSCVLSCPNKYFQNIATLTCDLCNLTICETCKTNANNCLTCAVNYFYDSVSLLCTLVCPTSYYPQTLTRTCKSCQYPCQQCTNTSYCMKCESSYKLYLNRCYSSCPIGYFSTSLGICQKCATNCQICSSSTNCKKCSSFYYVENGICVTNCSLGLYKGKQDMTNYDYCLSCPTNCQQCQDYNTCLLCVNGYYLFNGLCLTQCPILHYSDTVALTCQQCSQNCVSCVNSTYCTKCINSYIYRNQCYSSCPSLTYVFNEQSCQICVSPCLQCQSQFTCATCIAGYFYYHAYCVTSCPSGVWYYPHNNTCSQSCPYNKYEAKMICYISGCGGKLVQMNGYCLSNCPIGYYVSKSQSCIICSSNQQICDNLFIADLQILRSQQLTLVLYFSQKSDILSSIDDVNITFADDNNKITELTLKDYEFTNYALKFKYNYEQVKFLTVYLTIPYLDSQQTQQAISSCSYNKQIYYFNNYQSDKQSIIYTISNYLPLIMSLGLFITIILNIIAKNSYFLQLLDMMQLIGACLYLEIQYPIFLQKFLNSMGNMLFLFMPKIMQHFPYTFSSSKYIFYNIDTSFTRTHLLTFILFLILFIVMITVVVVNRYWGYLATITNRIKYRNLNDLFSILSFPLLLFSFSFYDSKTIDLVISFMVILFALSWIIFISNLIIQAEQMGDLMGLLSDYQAVSSKLGLMYTPFSYIRRFIVALVFCVFPQKPLAALTLLLIFTILILICLFFYQPFASQITDYISMYLQFTLIIFIILIVMIGLDVLGEDGNKIIGTVAVIIVSLAMIVGLGWLLYLTFGGMKKYYENWNKQEQKDTQDCIKNENKSSSENAIHNKGQNEGGQNQQSASHLMKGNNKRNHYQMQDIESEGHSNSNKEQFKHWNEEDEDEQESNKKQQRSQNKRAPQLLMKKVLQQKQQQKQQKQQKQQD